MGYIVVAVGGSGIKLTLAFYKQLRIFFNLDQDGFLIQNENLKNINNNVKTEVNEYRISKFFYPKEVGKDGRIKYYPNVIFLDSDMDSFNTIFYSPEGNLYDLDSYVIKDIKLRGIYNPYHDIQDLKEPFKNQASLIQLQHEKFPINGLIQIGSICGGFSSSISILIEEWWLEISEQGNIYKFELLPDFNREFHNTINLYNFILGYDPPRAKLNINFTNSGAQSVMLQKTYQLHEEKDFSQTNHFLAQNIFDIVSSTIKHTNLNSSMHKMCTNLTMFPRVNSAVINTNLNSLDFLMVEDLEYENQTLQSLKDPKSCLFPNVDMLSDADKNRQNSLFVGFFQTHSPQISEDLFMQTANSHIQKLVDKKRAQCWIPNGGVNYSFCEGDDMQYIPLKKQYALNQDSQQFQQSYQSGSQVGRGQFVGITTGIAEYWEKINGYFTESFRRKSFLHHYTQYVDEMEFTEGESKLNDLISEYMWSNNTHYYGDYGDDEEEEGFDNSGYEDDDEDEGDGGEGGENEEEEDDEDFGNSNSSSN